MDYMQGIIFGGFGILAFIVLVGLLKTLVRVALPNRIMVVTGRKTKRSGKLSAFQSIAEERLSSLIFRRSVRLTLMCFRSMCV